MTDNEMKKKIGELDESIASILRYIRYTKNIVSSIYPLLLALLLLALINISNAYLRDKKINEKLDQLIERVETFKEK